MKKSVNTYDLERELANECQNIGLNLFEDNESRVELRRQCIVSSARARCLMDLLVRYCCELEPDIEGYALRIINEELFSRFGNLDTGECQFQVLSWDDVEKQNDSWGEKA